MNNKKTIFITGSSSGVGRATARLFAANGWNVIATMRSPEKATELDNVDGITKYALDVTNAEQVTALAEKFGAETDVVLNNAGYGLAGPLEGITDEQMLREFDTNLMGTVRTTRAFLPYFREKRAGLFINTVSIGGIVALPFNSSYIATKWATEGWSEAMSFELEPPWNRHQNGAARRNKHGFLRFHGDRTSPCLRGACEPYTLRICGSGEYENLL